MIITNNAFGMLEMKQLRAFYFHVILTCLKFFSGGAEENHGRNKSL
jgi:hypothetical protein